MALGVTDAPARPIEKCQSSSAKSRPLGVSSFLTYLTGKLSPLPEPCPPECKSLLTYLTGKLSPIFTEGCLPSPLEKRLQEGLSPLRSAGRGTFSQVEMPHRAKEMTE